MPNKPCVTIRLRLEDFVALVFFLMNLTIRVVFRGLERQNVSPADVLIIIPAVALLLGKELIHYFLAKKDFVAESHAGPIEFIRPYWGIVRDWLPFLIILLMYYSMWGDATLLLVSHDRDQELIALDQKLFHCQASVVLQRFISPTLTAWMDFAYFFHVLNIPLVGCFIYLRKPRERFREMMSGLMVVCFLGLLAYLLVPAIGPMYTLRNLYTVPLSQPVPVFNQQIEFMDFARIRRDVFPSMHVAISFLVWLYAYRNSKRLFWILSPLILSLWVSAVYLRYHYLIDIAAGLVLAPLCYWIANWMFARFSEIPVSAAVPAILAERLAWGRTVDAEAKTAEKVRERP